VAPVGIHREEHGYSGGFIEAIQRGQITRQMTSRPDQSLKDTVTELEKRMIVEALSVAEKPATGRAGVGFEPAGPD
jgi:hypothetical protein